MASILVVDDDPDLGDWATVILRQKGHQVLTRSSACFMVEPKHGVQLPMSFDVAIIDMIMPEVDGIEAIRALKAVCPSTRVIAISGGGTYSAAEVYLRWAQLFGAVAALTKPFTSSDLCDTVERALHPT